MGIFDDGESAEVISLLNYLNNTKNWESNHQHTFQFVTGMWANRTGMSVQKVLSLKDAVSRAMRSDLHPTGERRLRKSATNWVDALKEAWDNEEPMMTIRNDGEDIQIHEIFGWNESNLGLTGSQKEVDYNWTAIGRGREMALFGFGHEVEDSNREESFVFENFKAFLTTVGSIEMIEVKEDQGGGNWKTVEIPNYIGEQTGYLLIQSVLIPQPYNLILPKITRDKMRKELTELHP